MSQGKKTAPHRTVGLLGSSLANSVQAYAKMFYKFLKDSNTD